ncbi:hypothetical protein [Streptomyces sp. NRRL F-5630]|uniref:hypothetical protein n=1 Tax=Streptomyces sp. NRRL F-5630 TaxID=1463864 RepID=UPI003D73BA99
MALVVGVLVVGAACGSPEGDAGDAEALRERARRVGAAWEGSEAAASWRAGYHPVSGAVRPPRGGWHGGDDQRAYEKGAFVVRGKLPRTGAKKARVAWAGQAPVVRPLVEARDAYAAMAFGPDGGGKPHLTVTGARLGTMTVATPRDPAAVPAWLFALDGYDTPLRRAAATPSPAPRSPIAPTRSVPGQRVDRLTGVGADGRAVTVLASHGACDDGPRVAVLETRDGVVLSGSVAKTRHTGLCTKQSKLTPVRVRLKRPLDGRVVLDALTGAPVPYKEIPAD